LNDFYATISNDGLPSLKLLHKADDKLIISLPIQNATKDHRSYILSTWVKSYEAEARRVVCGTASGGYLHIPHDVYRSGESATAERHWEKSKVVTSDDGYTIHAWVCAEPGALWHVYVPPTLRGGGVARELVEAYAGKVYMVSKPWPKHTPGLHNVTYNPYMIV